MSAGFQFNNSWSMGDNCGSGREYDIPSDNGGRLAVGDAVTLTGDSNSLTGVSEIVIASQGAAIMGVIQSISPDIANESFNDAGGIAASTAGKANVIIDPQAMFEVECSATLSSGDADLNADAVVTAATQSGGLTISNMTLDSATKAATNTLHFHVHKLLKGATSGVLGDRALVSLNNTFLHTGVTGKA